jgi:hypothetical protein
VQRHASKSAREPSVGRIRCGNDSEQPADVRKFRQEASWPEWLRLEDASNGIDSENDVEQ